MNKPKRTLVCGDIHGGYKSLLQIIERSNFNTKEDQERNGKWLLLSSIFLGILFQFHYQFIFVLISISLWLIFLSKDKLKEIITKLFDYVGTHFSNEQKYMESVDYPELENHKFLHKNMLMMLTTLISELNKMELKEIQEYVKK